ncbi:MAG: alanine racemase [Acholeplasmataceae bacterium]|nr:alanine racemase [Acholeplasmataceae bacterium]
MFYRPTWVEINLEALAHNYHFVKNQVASKQVVPVIKADAYGHGAVKVMNRLIQEGVKLVAVSLLEEAIELRRENQTIDILIMGPVLKDQFDLCHEHHFQLTVYNHDIAQAILSYPQSLMCHLKIDTGMHRYGISDVNFMCEWMIKLKSTKHNLKGIYTHLATANEQDNLFFSQIESMKALLEQLPYLPEMIHVSNSSASLRYEKYLTWTTHVRLGISLYGLSLDKDQKGLHPVMSLKSKVIDLKTLNLGDPLGYGASYHAKEQHEKIAILPIGYADGWIRKNKTGFVEIKGKLFPMVGIICMDACFVKVDDSIKLNDEVTLFGGKITTDEVASRLNTISYEIVCQISKRVPRIYIKEE